MLYVGQKVVCVNDTVGIFDKPHINYKKNLGLNVVKGEVYTISQLINHPDGSYCVKLVGVPDRNCRDFGYNIKRFRPAVEKKTDISIFKSMLNKTPQQNRKELLNV